MLYRAHWLAASMLAARQLLALGLAAILLCAIQGVANDAASPSWTCSAGHSNCRSVTIVHNSWHAAIVLRQSDLAANPIPELADFPAAQFIEFGWGDQDYFPDPNSGVFAAIKAGLWSSGSVIHLVGFSDPIEDFYRGAAITGLRMNEAAYRRLLGYIDETFRRDSRSNRAPAAAGLFAYSRFYPAHRRFSLLRTCNTWVAEALEQAGLPISAAFVITAGHLQNQLAAVTRAP